MSRTWEAEAAETAAEPEVAVWAAAVLHSVGEPSLIITSRRALRLKVRAFWTPRLDRLEQILNEPEESEEKSNE